MSFTDAALHIMQTNSKGWDYCGNAQASVDGVHQIIVACDVTAEANDKQQAVPMALLTAANLEQAGIKRPKDAAGGVEKIPVRMTAAITVRQRQKPWSSWDLLVYGHGPSTTPCPGACGG